jgi:hypothetical protein
MHLGTIAQAISCFAYVRWFVPGAKAHAARENHLRSVDEEYVRELFKAFGAITVRRMFGGAGIFSDGVMFGLFSGAHLYLKRNR